LLTFNLHERTWGQSYKTFRRFISFIRWPTWSTKNWKILFSSNQTLDLNAIKLQLPKYFVWLVVVVDRWLLFEDGRKLCFDFNNTTSCCSFFNSEYNKTKDSILLCSLSLTHSLSRCVCVCVFCSWSHISQPWTCKVPKLRWRRQVIETSWTNH